MDLFMCYTMGVVAHKNKSWGHYWQLFWCHDLIGCRTLSYDQVIKYVRLNVGKWLIKADLIYRTRVRDMRQQAAEI